MNISAITPSYGTNNVQAKRPNVQFTGNLGDKFVNQILNGSTVKPNDVIKEMKGTFGIKTDKAEDIMESFIGKVKQLFKDKNSLTMKVNEQERKINAFPDEKRDAVWDAEAKVRESFQSVIKSKNEEVAAKDRELADMKSKLEKYQQVVKVKSVEEIDTIMPDKAIELIDEMIKNKIPSRKSMADFLLSGKGQEDALAQLERNNMLMKARRDGITEISEVKAKIDNDMHNSGIWFNNDSYFTLNMIGDALKGCSKGGYLKSPVIKKQVKENAMAILTPMANERYYNESVGALSKKLDETLDYVVKYHDGIAKGTEKIKKNNRDYPNPEFKPVEFSPEDSKIVFNVGDRSWEYDYNWLAHYGSSNW